jgi:Mg2+/Co2+ transporter CorC
MVTLTCTGVGAVQQWSYNTENVGGLIIAAIGQVPATPLTVGGVKFRLSLLSTMDAPYLASQITFVASEKFPPFHSM